jgi:very-short-patch-repair endonuclease
LGQTIRQAKLEKARALRRNMTAAERLLWERLRANRLHGCHFRRQHIIHGFIVDFYCHAAALIVEVDGDVHENTKAYDRERGLVLSSKGLLTLRFTNDDVLNQTERVLTKIEATCMERDQCILDDSPFPPRERGQGDRSP